ncbi:MAG: heme-copper oxidase subunit III [Phycisphaerae bacterium]|nr:hypothetical protein [Tepidisphaeraceae bacterium]
MAHDAPQYTLDVSTLPDNAMDARAPLWWGNLLLVCIETTTIVILLVVYFYVRRNFGQWPPPRVDRGPALFDQAPSLWAATANAVLLAVSALPMYWADTRARALDTRRTAAGLALMTAVAAASIVLTALEMRALDFRWDENAYGSVVWTIAVMFMIYLIAGIIEFGLMLVWVLRHGLDDKHALDVTLAGGYWYWVAATGVVIYAVVFLYPRMT